MLQLIYKELSLSLGNSFHTEIMQPKDMLIINLQIVHGNRYYFVAIFYIMVIFYIECYSLYKIPCLNIDNGFRTEIMHPKDMLHIIS